MYLLLCIFAFHFKFEIYVNFLNVFIVYNEMHVPLPAPMLLVGLTVLRFAKNVH